jgi:hypothetical protein
MKVFGVGDRNDDGELNRAARNAHLGCRSAGNRPETRRRRSQREWRSIAYHFRDPNMRAADLAPLELLSLASLGTVAAALAVFDPAVTWWFPSCPFHAITGWLCPLCGSLRAVHALLAGHPLAALAFNPLTIVGLGMWLVARERTTRFCFSGAGIALLVGFGLFRNL